MSETEYMYQLFKTNPKVRWCGATLGGMNI